jgi:hypothetical protein
MKKGMNAFNQRNIQNKTGSGKLILGPKIMSNLVRIFLVEETFRPAELPG